MDYSGEVILVQQSVQEQDTDLHIEERNRQDKTISKKGLLSSNRVERIELLQCMIEFIFRGFLDPNL
jgi:hypothetical protein